MPLSPADESLISFYFRAESLFAHSTFGAQMDRLRNAKGGPPPSWAWRPPVGHYAGAPRPGPPVHVSNARQEEGGYEVDHRDLLRYSRASRRMDAVGRADPLAYAVLSSYYGDRGARWAAIGVGRLDEATGQPVGHGAGPGSIASLYALTEAGQRLIRRERELGAEMRSGGHGRRGEKRETMAEARRRGDEVAGALERKRMEVQRCHEVHRAIARALLDVRKRVQAARAQGPVPSAMRAELSAAATAARQAGDRLMEARRTLALLTWRPSSGFHSPRLDAPSVEPVGPLQGPRLEDGRFYTDVTLSTHAPLARIIRPERHCADPSHQTDDDVLEVAFVLEQACPHKPRAQRLAAARDQADALLVRAWGAWLATAPQGPSRIGGGPRRRILSARKPGFGREMFQ